MAKETPRSVIEQYAKTITDPRTNRELRDRLTDKSKIANLPKLVEDEKQK